MVKLVPAKCPNCGGELELDDNLKRTECKYCNSTIVVDDAIAKYKLEVSGNVKVSSVKDYSDRIDIVKKHIKVGKIDDAIDELKKILVDDPYCLPALKIYIDLMIDKETFFIEYISDEVLFVNIIKDNINIVEKIDDNHEYSEFVVNARKRLSKFDDILKKANYNKLVDRCNDYIIMFSDLMDERKTEILNHFGIKDINEKEIEEYIKKKVYQEHGEEISVDDYNKYSSEKINEEIEYIYKLIENYDSSAIEKKKEIETEKIIKKVKNDKKSRFIAKILSSILTIIMVVLEWLYIFYDIKQSFESISLIKILAAIIYVVIGIGVTFLILFISVPINALIEKIVSKIINRK